WRTSLTVQALGCISRTRIRRASPRPPSRGAPERGRSSSPPTPSRLKRSIHRRTVRESQSNKAAICEPVSPRRDNQIITRRRAKRQGPCSRAPISAWASGQGLAKTCAGRKNRVASLVVVEDAYEAYFFSYFSPPAPTPSRHHNPSYGQDFCLPA